MSTYYQNPAVRERIVEFLGGGPLATSATVYLLGHRESDPHAFLDLQPRPPTDLWDCLANGLELHRSLWDSESLVADLEIEYVHFDDPEAPYRCPERAFELQQPVEEGVEEVLLRAGIAPLHLLSGRGHHFVWRVKRDSRAFWELAQLGRMPTSLAEGYRELKPPADQAVSPELAAAFAGLGLVLEWVAHRVKEAFARHCPVPLELTAVTVGPGEHGREMVAVDLSEYGDPLDTRTLSVPFTPYRKPWRQRGLISEDLLQQLPDLWIIPLHEMDTCAGLQVRCDIEQVASLAARASARIPDQSAPMAVLIAGYRRSDVARFHEWFYAEEHHPQELWPTTYDRAELGGLPPCARRVLQQPNDLLLQPAGIQLVVRSLLALGWHPRHIAGLIRSRYERDFGWGGQWMVYDPAARADFYTRIFAGLFAVGRDNLIDLNCPSNQEKGLCCQPYCGTNLARVSESLLARRRHERLACRPFDRLFLPEHDR